MRLMKRRHPDRVLPVEITPMIDVVFLLIIFFMTTAQFAQRTRAEVELPREQGEQSPSDPAGVVINLMHDGRIIVNERAVDMDALVQMVADEAARTEGGASQMKLLLRADRNADALQLNEVVTRLQRAGIPAARIATHVP